MLCFIPLALALHIMTWATALGSTTSLAFLSPLPSSRIKRSPPCRAFINAIAICFAVLFVFSLIPSTVLTVLRRRNLLKKVSQVLIAAQAVGEAADQIGALTALLPQFEQLEEEGRKLFRAYEGVVSLYVGWGLCWLTVRITVFTPGRCSPFAEICLLPCLRYISHLRSSLSMHFASVDVVFVVVSRVSELSTN